MKETTLSAPQTSVSGRRSVLRRTALGALALPSAVGSLAALAACAGPASSPTDVAPPPGKIERGTKISLVDTGALWNEPLASTTKPLFDAWQSKTGITFERIDDGTSSDEKLQTLLAAGTPPDLTSIGGTSDKLGLLVATNAVLPLDPLLKRDKYDTSDLYPYALEHSRARNTQWGLPQTVNPVVMFHNTDLFTRAGIQPPPANWKAPGWSWADLLSVGQRLTRPGDDGSQPVFGALMNNNLKVPAIAVWSYGGELFDKDLTRCTLDSPPAIEALQMLADLVQRHRISPTAAQLQAANPRTLFRTGRAAMLGSGQNLNFINNIRQDKPSFPWGVSAFPRGTAGRVPLRAVVGAFVILKASKQQEAAWEFQKFMQSPDLARIRAQEGSDGMSARKSVMAEVLKDPKADFPPGYAEIIDLGDAPRRWPLIPRWLEVSDVLDLNFRRLFDGTVSVKQIVTDTVSQVDPLMKERL